MAGGLGFEPRLTGPEPVVLPLDDPPVCKPTYYKINFLESRNFVHWLKSITFGGLRLEVGGLRPAPLAVLG